jgi:hypothetical protein
MRVVGVAGEMRADRLDAGVGVLSEVDPVAHGNPGDEGKVLTITQPWLRVWNECAAVSRAMQRWIFSLALKVLL